MKLVEIIDMMGFEVINRKEIDGDIIIEHGYASDLLSQVLAASRSNSIWMTIQSHMNIIGVASMAGILAIVICEDHTVPDMVIDKADEENIVLLRSSENAFQISGKLYENGIR